MKEYKVTYGESVNYLTAEELKNFINIAVINNKDINNFTVTRITK